MATYELKDAGLSIVCDSGQDPIPRITHKQLRNTIAFPDDARERVKVMLERFKATGEPPFALYGVHLA